MKQMLFQVEKWDEYHPKMNIVTDETLFVCMTESEIRFDRRMLFESLNGETGMI